MLIGKKKPQNFEQQEYNNHTEFSRTIQILQVRMYKIL